MKGQLSWEQVVTILIFIGVVTYFFSRILSVLPPYFRELEKEDKRIELFRTSELIINDPGEPVDWQGNVWILFWKYELPLNLTGRDLADYPINFTFDTLSLISQGKMNSTCKDIRFSDSSRNELPYYLDQASCNSLKTKIWVRVPSISASRNTTIYMYYGNPSAESKSDINTIFSFIDDFSDSSYTSASWNLTAKF